MSRPMGLTLANEEETSWPPSARMRFRIAPPLNDEPGVLTSTGSVRHQTFQCLIEYLIVSMPKSMGKIDLSRVEAAP